MTEELPFCECGCGKKVTKKGNRFIRGHVSRVKDYHKPKPEPQLCKCGCGELTKPGKDYINGHQRREIFHTNETRLQMLKSKIEFYEDHPERLNEISKDRTEFYSIQENRDNQSLKMLKYYEDPINQALASKRSTKRWAKQSERDAQSDRRNKYLEDNPEVKEAYTKLILNASKKYWLNQDNRDEQSERLKNSNAHKAASEAERGGMDIIQHHYIYDDSNRSKHTIGITRSDHMRLHRLLQKLGYIIPHINVKEQS